MAYCRKRDANGNVSLVGAGKPICNFDLAASAPHYVLPTGWCVPIEGEIFGTKFEMDIPLAAYNDSRAGWVNQYLGPNATVNNPSQLQAVATWRAANPSATVRETSMYEEDGKTFWDGAAIADFTARITGKTVDGAGVTSYQLETVNNGVRRSVSVTSNELMLSTGWAMRAGLSLGVDAPAKLFMGLVKRFEDAI